MNSLDFCTTGSVGRAVLQYQQRVPLLVLAALRRKILLSLVMTEAHGVFRVLRCLLQKPTLLSLWLAVSNGTFRARPLTMPSAFNLRRTVARLTLPNLMDTVAASCLKLMAGLLLYKLDEILYHVLASFAALHPDTLICYAARLRISFQPAR